MTRPSMHRRHIVAALLFTSLSTSCKSESSGGSGGGGAPTEQKKAGAAPETAAATGQDAKDAPVTVAQNDPKSEPKDASRSTSGDASDPGKVFSGDNADLYSKTTKELDKVPQHLLDAEIMNTLKPRDAAEEVELLKIKAFNCELCRELVEVRTRCPSQLYLVKDVGLRNLNCSSATVLEGQTGVKVELKNDRGKTFRLQANHDYVTDEFSGASAVVTFKKLLGNQQNVKSPRFRELTSLNIITVTPGSAVVQNTISGRTERPADLEIRISVGILDESGSSLIKDLPLVMGPDGGFTKPVPPAQDDGRSTFRIAPVEILKLGNVPDCVYTQGQLDQIQTQADERAQEIVNECGGGAK